MIIYTSKDTSWWRPECPSCRFEFKHKTRVYLHDGPRKISRMNEEIIQTDEEDFNFWFNPANFKEPGWKDGRLNNLKNLEKYINEHRKELL